MASVEQEYKKAQERVSDAVPEIPIEEASAEPVPEKPENEIDKRAWREEFKKNIEDFLERDDTEGLAAFVERIVHFDSLTNVLNRPGFIAEAEPIMDEVANLEEGKDRRTGEYTSFNVLFIDLDRFKNINDTYGHAAGDAALEKTAHVLRESLRDDDIIGRWGGEEFVVAFTCSSKRDQIKRHRFLVAEKVRRAIEAVELEFEGNRIQLTASIGTALRRPEEEVLTDVVSRADKAMYVAKQRSRNAVAIAEEEGILPSF